MKHNLKNWAIVGSLQLGILLGGFSLPNNIINAATWYAPILDFGRITLLFGFPIGDIVFLQKMFGIGSRRKEQL
jgi:hypothetical protein